jgi:predicted Zn-dependent protease
MKRRNPLTNDTEKQYDEIYELFLQDNFTEANKRGQMLLKTTPDHEKTMLLLGQIALVRKQWPRAREWYNKLLEKTPGLTAARV